jgi:hypothetical protein
MMVVSSELADFVVDACFRNCAEFETSYNITINIRDKASPRDA